MKCEKRSSVVTYSVAGCQIRLRYASISDAMTTVSVPSEMNSLLEKYVRGSCLLGACRVTGVHLIMAARFGLRTSRFDYFST